MATWRNVDGRHGGSPATLAVSSSRALADAIITAVLAREGKRRWCETCTAMPEIAEAFLEIYPATRFVCLYRSCVGVIRAVLDASPWGITDPVLAPFIRAHPVAAAAVTAYWTAHTESMLAFEQAHPHAALHLRFEDLATAEYETGRAVAAFLDVAVLDSGGTTLGYGALTPPESDSSYTAPGVLTSPEADLPATLIPPAIAARANDLLRQLDYPILPELG